MTIQAQILELLNELKAKLGMAIMLITHDMGVIAETAQRVVVMYAAKVVEEAPVERAVQGAAAPVHAGAAALDSRASTSPPPRRRSWRRSRARCPRCAARRSPGCRFAPRCQFAKPMHFENTRPLKEVRPGHKVACFLY